MLATTLDEDGNPSGFAIDVMNEVAKRTGFKVTYRVKKNWAEVFKALRTGDIDIVPNLGITERRKEYAAYTVPLETFHISIFVRDDTHDVKGLGDLSGRPVAVVATNAARRILKSRDDIQLRVFDNFTEALFALLSAEVDAFAFPEPVTWKLAREARVDKQIKVVGEPLKEIRRAMAVPKDKVELLATLDRAVRDFVASPEYRSIYVAWFGKPDPYWTVARVAWTMGGAMAVFLIAMVWWRYRVGVRMIRALKESEARFKDIAETSADRFWEMDENFRFTSNIDYPDRRMSPKPEHFTGRTRWEAAGADPEKDEKWRRHREDLLAHRPYRDFQFSITDEDGEIHHLSVSGTPVFDDAGVFKGYRGSATSITERKQAEEALRKSEALLRAVVDNSPTKIHIKDVEGRYTLINKEAEKLFGITDEEGRGKTSYDLFPKKVADTFMAHDKAVIDGGKPTEEEEEFTLEDGVHTFLTVKFPIYDLDGVSGVGAIGTDITERKKAEEDVQRLAHAIEGLSENFALYGPDDRLVMCNKGYRKLNKAVAKSVKPGALFEDHVRALVKRGLVPEAVGREEEYIRARLERHRNPGGPFEIERQGGQWFLVHEQRMPDGSMAIIAPDITELKRAEEALRESEEQNRLILESAGEGIYGLDLKGRTTSVNPAAARMTGWKPKDLIGKLQHDIQHHTRPDGSPYPAEECPICAAFKDGKAHHVSDEVFWRKNGSSFPVEYISTPIRKDGALTGAVVIFSDITERKHAYDAMMAAKREAEKANRAKSEFLASMSHELRTPLNAILGFADILSHQHLGPTSEKYKEYAEDIQASAEHLLTLVNEILDLSTIEAGKQSLVKEKLSTEEIVTECVRIVEEKARSSGVDLVTKVPKDIPPLYADRRAAKQILLNLLSNAVKFTPEGGKITVSAKASKRNTTLKIADTGKGILAKKLPKLTDPFTRVDGDPYLAEQSWGLGLAISKSLIDLHDGTLDIKSKVGKGTTVTLTFPNGAP